MHRLAASIMRTTVIGVCLSGVVLAQSAEPVVAKDGISVHRVERGVMTLRETTTGSITSLDPARATVDLTPEQSNVVTLGQLCSVQVASPPLLHGRVTRIHADSSRGVVIADIDIADRLPPATAVGAGLGALIDVGTTGEMILFDHPATARPHTSSTIFVLNSDGTYASRVPVTYGRLSGSQLEILSGLAPGDRVIVTEIPQAAGHDRIRLR